MAGRASRFAAACCLGVTALAVDPVTPACLEGACHSQQQHDSMLFQQAHNSSRRSVLQGMELLTGSCLPPYTERGEDPPPAERQSKGNPHNITLYCATEKLGWPMSDYALGLLSSNGIDADEYKFKLCYDQNGDPEKRQFPWVHVTDWKSWRLHNAAEGSVFLGTIDASKRWRHGFQEILPDALEYFANAGEIAGRKIKPRFMLHGWSKGCTFIFNLNKWRPDLLQGVSCLSGCNDKKGVFLGDELVKKAAPEGAAPIIWFQSKKDTFLKCTKGHIDKAFKFLNGRSTSTVIRHKFPCGHYPRACEPVCDRDEVFATPFLDFKATAYAWDGGCHTDVKDTCESWLCVWDDDLPAGSRCHAVHPTSFTAECQSFCSSAAADTCTGLSEADCSGSHVVAEGGWHKKCVFTSGACAASDKAKQCLFQDQCQATQ